MSGTNERGAVAIVGVGAMGLAVGERLLAAGYAVHGFRRGDLSAFIARGGQPLASAADAHPFDPVLVLLPDDDALARVVETLFPRLSQGQTIICLSTHSLEVKTRASDAAAAQGAILLEGEISGTPTMIRSGCAKLLIAGDAQATENVMSLLEVAIGNVTCLPKFGDAAHVKLIINYLVALHTLAAAEALALAQAMGISPHCVLDAAADSAAGSTMLAIRGRMMTEGDYSDGNVSGLFKFFGILKNRVPNRVEDLPLFAQVEETYRRAIEAGFGESGPSVVFELLKRTAHSPATI